ncbi:MAG: GLPGLI family protein [Bacteroidales bacterium]|jgi:GLPGLI family protein|nr:GLPGLI family protein [Bacteroidales bacterium]MCI2146340.1 GLPGLI family protein [Bacteroidales bacterium]
MMVFDGQATCQVRDVAEKKSIGEYMLSITYEYVFAIDTVSSIRKTDLEKLEIGLEMSRYYSVFADRCDSVMYKYRIENPNTERGVNEQAWMKDFQQAIYDDYYLNYPGEGILTSRQRIVNVEYEYSEPIPEFEWRILPDTTDMVMGYRCNIAETTFRGRNYCVSFTTSIPFPNGPWKFNGTPGLILKAEEQTGLFRWEAVGIKEGKGPIYIFDPKACKPAKWAPEMTIRKVSRKQVLALQKKKWSDPVGLMIQHGTQVSTYDPKTKKLIDLSSGDVRYKYIPPLELE